MNLEQIGKALLIFAAVLAVAGVILFVFGRGLGIQRLPGDILIKRDRFTFYFPIVASLLVSLVLTIVINVVLWLLRR